jgi:hypothetical protein
MAAAKIDKQMLIKHRFWILAGFFFLLVLIPLLVLTTSVSPTIGAEEVKLTQAKKTLNDIKNPKSDKWVDALKTADIEVNRRKNEVWEQAWEMQKDMMTWPADLNDTFKEKYKYFGDPIDGFEREDFSKHYESQLPELTKLVQMLEQDGKGGKGAVFFRNGWDSTLNLAKSFAKHPPSSDDIWIAQEDVWVRRELLRIIRDANDSVAIFKEVKPKDAAGAKDKKEANPGAEPAGTVHKVFRNPNWELELTLAHNNKGQYFLRGRLTNISSRVQRRGMNFKVFLQERGEGSSYAPLFVDGLPMKAGETVEIPETSVPDTATIQGLCGVEQVLTWLTAPVKRIDRLEPFVLSSRTCLRTLKPPLFYKSDKKAALGSGEQIPESMRLAGQFSMNEKAQAQSGAAPPPPTDGPSGDSTLNGYPLDRYVDRNEQVRHMPVGLVVIADEERIQDLLAAVANSKLRIQTTQVHWVHFRNKLQPNIEEEPSLNNKPKRGERLIGKAPGRREGAPKPSRSTASLPGGVDPEGDLMKAGNLPGPETQATMGAGNASPSPFFGPRMGSQTAGANKDSDDEDMNLVEVAVYGIASLYERYPPKSAVARAAAAPAPAGGK